MKKLPKKTKFKKIFAFLFCAILVLSFLQLSFTNGLATEGKNLKNIQEEIELLSEQNTKLKEQVSVLSSLSRIEKEASSFGMVKVSSLEFVVSPEVASIR